MQIRRHLLLSISPPLLLRSCSAAECDCDGCPDKEKVFVGLHETLTSPSCAEGSVATVTKLRSADTNGQYKVTVWNTGSYSAEAGVGAQPYIYREAGADNDVECYQLASEKLPVIGDQTEIKVTLNCEALTFCDFQWDVQFGCGETGVTDPENGGLQVLSDVDDTVTCSNPSATCDDVKSCTLEGSLSAYLAGVDRRLEHKEMYPGAAQLMLGLALGKGDGDGGKYHPAKPMFLSARPREAANILAIDQDSKINAYLESAGDRHGRESWGANVDGSFYGTVFDGTSYKEYGQTKAKHFESFSSKNPNTRFAFVGDNGQGDQCAAQSMLEGAGGDRLAAVLIHEVKDRAGEIAECESPAGADFALNLPEGEKVHYFRTHPDAALWSLERELISCCSASNVRYAAEEWHRCRCSGECPEGGLPTGVSELATREETLSYCGEVESDLASLADAVAACDPNWDCAAPGEYVPTPLNAGIGGSFSGVISVITLLGMVAAMG